MVRWMSRLTVKVLSAAYHDLYSIDHLSASICRILSFYMRTFTSPCCLDLMIA